MADAPVKTVEAVTRKDVYSVISSPVFREAFCEGLDVLEGEKDPGWEVIAENHHGC